MRTAAEPLLRDDFAAAPLGARTAPVDSGNPGARIQTRSAVRLRISAILFSAIILVFLFSPVLDRCDSVYSMLLSESILEHHSTNLNGYRIPGVIEYITNSSPPVTTHHRNYQIGRLHGRVVYRYPHGSSLLSLPYVAMMRYAGISAATADGEYSSVGELFIEKTLAATLMAALVCIVFATAMLELPLAPSLAIAVVFALGTQVWSTASRGLWSHSWFIFLGGIVVYLMLRWETQDRPPPPAALATLLSWMYFVRPTGAIPIACITVYLFLFHRKHLVGYAITGAVWFGLFIAYSWMTFGELVPSYYRHHLDFNAFPVALFGVLFSPSRGLLIFVPISGFVIYLVMRYRDALPSFRVAALAGAIIATHVLTVAGYPCWWGGLSYGPRLMTDILPWLALLAIEGCAGAAAMGRKWILTRSELAVCALAAVVSIAINARGAFSFSCQMWSLQVAIDTHPERAFDWSYPQFAAGLISPPAYAADVSPPAPNSFR